jgi:mannose-1-phosphate guanylyltransferase
MCFLLMFSCTGWDDVGDFSSLADLLPAEANQPRVLGDPALGTSLPYFSLPIELIVPVQF